jgi:hypothetical protein
VLRARAGSRQLRRDLTRSQAELTRTKSASTEIKAANANG